MAAVTLPCDKATKSCPDLASTGGISWNGSPSKGQLGRFGGGVMLSETESTWPLGRIETPHQTLQRSLEKRRGGAPIEQCMSPPQRLRSLRNTEILHSSLEEPLSTYKSLEPIRPKWPAYWRRLHLNDGIRVKDQDTILVEARDQHVKTRKGLIRVSSGHVTYSESHRAKAEIDVMMLAQIVNGGVPGGGHAWTPQKLQIVFKERTGRHGTWKNYEVPLKHFLSLFPKTFEQFGPDMRFVRLRHTLRPALMDSTEDAMARLACAKERGFIEQHPHIEGTVGLHNEELMEIFQAFDDAEKKKNDGRPCNCPSLSDLTSSLRAKTPSLPELRNQRVKASFKACKPQTR